MSWTVMLLVVVLVVLCAGCGGGARPVLVTPSPSEVSATSLPHPSTPVPSPTGTWPRLPLPLVPNETSTPARLPAQNETSTVGVLGISPTPSPTRPPLPSPMPPPTYTSLELNSAVVIGDDVFPVELAVSSGERAKGLSGRQMLESGTGMLFIFEDRTASSFWMWQMLFPLDFVWISVDCRVVDITPDVPFPSSGTPGSSLPTYRSSAPAAYNLEINAGEANKRGIRIGDAVRFTGIPDHVGDTCER